MRHHLPNRENILQKRPFVGKQKGVFDGRSGGAQTRGLMVPNHPRYQLRHTPIFYSVVVNYVVKGVFFVFRRCRLLPKNQGISTISGRRVFPVRTCGYTLPKVSRTCDFGVFKTS